MRFGIPTKYGWRRPSVKQKAVVFSPEPRVWRLMLGSRLIARKFASREEAKRWIPITL